jgi:hypothetical protein
MKLRIISEDVLRAHIPLKEAIANQRECFDTFKRSEKTKEVLVPERIISASKYGPILFKPFISDQVFGLKVVSVRNHGVPGKRQKRFFYSIFVFFPLRNQHFI